MKYLLLLFLFSHPTDTTDTVYFPLDQQQMEQDINQYYLQEILRAFQIDSL